MYVCMCVYVCMYVCMHVCMYVSMYVYLLTTLLHKIQMLHFQKVHHIELDKQNGVSNYIANNTSTISPAIPI